MRLKPWKMKPISLLRISESSSSLRLETSWPSMRYWPEVQTSRQPSIFIRVDFPEPDWPMMVTNSPRSTVRETPSRARTSFSPGL